ncbi:hypothetical protein H6763_00950 [Candidatus Nomurabacteria bacterium]|uniref:Uncharacterized protein n=2 Tax=Bacteria candidate phyla TaxID=1783234 RepID=A0A955KYC8_9BACT|nr:hypothetical protein [Candidatus Dojkabacteria bacterium]MCB9790104.1 hypothetical protein [Candidatus Nomurabacteria bacterium]MCB9803376.1 hypothetical protein [Candidatus Nomurabacteria bacterium]
MDIEDFKDQNELVLQTLKDFSNITTNLPNILILGSVGLTSHTQNVNYYRKIKDIDTIADMAYRSEIEDQLIERGYSRSTFIGRSMPFSNILIRYSSNRYTRFFKQDSCDLEILFTPFIYDKGRLRIELFPKFYASIPEKELIETELLGIKFNSLSAESLYAVKQLTHNSFGRIYKDDIQKRTLDHQALMNCINIEAYKVIVKEFKITIGFIPIPIKSLLYLTDK